jgi:hypothetical protein
MRNSSNAATSSEQALNESSKSETFPEPQDVSGSQARSSDSETRIEDWEKPEDEMDEDVDSEVPPHNPLGRVGNA